MQTEYAYRMRGLSEALTALRTIAEKLAKADVHTTVILLLGEDEACDWYVFANLDNPRPHDSARLNATLSAGGTPTEYSVDQLRSRPDLIFIGSGAFNHIKEGLEFFVLRTPHRKAARQVVSALRGIG